MIMRNEKIIFLIWLLLPLSFHYAAGEERDVLLKIFYSSSLNGNLDGCTCKLNPRAGLVKRAYFLKNGINPHNSIILDSGDILDVMKDTLLADYILQTYKETGYVAMAVGEQEFANGFNALLKYRTSFPLISHNLIICPDENSCAIFSLKPLIITKRNLTIGIFSLFDPDLVKFMNPEAKDKIKVKEPELISGNMMVLMKEYNVDLIVCLYHGYTHNAKTLINKVKGIHILVLGHEQLLIDMEKVNDTYIISPGKEGNRLGELTVLKNRTDKFSFINEFTSFDYYSDPDDDSTRKSIDEYYDKMIIE